MFTNYCIYMNNYPFINNKGYLHLCCKNSHNRIDGNIKTHTLSEMYYSAQYEELRSKMSNNESITGCNICYDQEAKNQRSFRHRALAGFSPQPFDDNKIRMLDLRIGSLCNLMCAMCHPTDSSKWQANYESYAKEILDASDNHIHTTIDSNAPNLLNWAEHDVSWQNIFCSIDKNLQQVYIAGGEPFYIKKFPQYIKELTNHANDANILINTNATKLIPDNTLNNFKNVSCRISIDGFGLHDDYQRQGQLWNEKLEVIEQYYNNLNVTFFDLTITALTVRSIPKLVEYLQVRYPDVNILFRPVVNRSYLDIRILPKDLIYHVLEFCNRHTDKKNFYNLSQLKSFLTYDDKVFPKDTLRKFITYWDKNSICKFYDVDESLNKWIYEDNSS